MIEISRDGEYSSDNAVNCAYIYVAGSPGTDAASVAKTVPFSDEILIDLDPDGNPIGIELLNQTARIPIESLISAFPALENARSQFSAQVESI